MNGTTAPFKTASGAMRTRAYRAAKRGELTHIARGIYLPTDAPVADWDLIEVATRRPEATICLTSALAHHDLTDDIPAQLDIAMYRGGRIPASNGAIAWHTFDRNTFHLGRTEIPIAGTDLTIGLYSPERTIADAFRLRGQVGYEIARDALKEWLRRGGKPAVMAQYALTLPRAQKPLMAALEVLA